MLCEIAENYLENLNPIAHKISNDIKAIKATYEHLWSTFSTDEQRQVINEKIIQPEILFKYSLSLNDLYVNGAAKPSGGTKTILDETTSSSWRDEHSGPFVWKTLSQIDLFSLECSHTKSNVISLLYPASANSNESGYLTKLDENVRWVLPPDNVCTDEQKEESDRGIISKLMGNAMCKLQSTVRLLTNLANNSLARSTETDSLVPGHNIVLAPTKQEKSILKPTAPPPPPPTMLLAVCETSSLLHQHENYEENSFGGDYVDGPSSKSTEPLKSNEENFDLVPKSGFDFLDNW